MTTRSSQTRSSRSATDLDEFFMRKAIDLARQAGGEEGLAPIGCVIVRDGEILAEGSNEVALRNDPTAHA